MLDSKIMNVYKKQCDCPEVQEVYQELVKWLGGRPHTLKVKTEIDQKRV